MKKQELKKDHLLPGQMVSADNYISRAPGRIYHTKGNPDQSDMFSGGCVFIDHASGYVSIKHQVDINSTETVKAKLTFEREAQSQGVVIKGYHTDNEIFNTSEFMDYLLKKQQKIRFSLAGASHQNGAAESTIKTVVSMAGTMLMHAVLGFPEDIFFTDLWTMAMDYAVWVYNCIPDMQSGLFAIEICSRSRFELVSETFSNFHVWGSSAYFLEEKLQKPEVKIPKQDTRSRRGFDMGLIKIHSTQVWLVLNLLTGSISPQYHVIFYYMFPTVMSSTAAEQKICIRLVTSSNSRIQVMLDQ